MCGPSSQQKALATKEASFADIAQQQATSLFGSASKVFASIWDNFSPIVAAGPNQEGFSQAEKAARTSQITEGTAQTYAKASKALGENIASAGGGNAFVPVGANNQLREDLVAKAAQTESGEIADLTKENYATGRQNWLEAGKYLSNSTNVFNPSTEATNATNKSFEVASNQANENAKASNSWMGLVGGIIGSGLGGWATGGFKTPGSGK